QIAADEWLRTAQAYQNIRLDRWRVLPDGIRAVVIVDSRQDNRQAESKSTYPRSQPKPHALTAFIARFKAAAAKRINLVRGQPGAPVWQRGYHEQRIEDETMLVRLRQLLADSGQ
ncbi:MAG: hypothetical protein F6J97_21490, partial [Leptolyngbya sp. SIO4C1]|nr:hypothetical protein [Leptolyngbya sp. SIO4C1]